MRAASSAGVLRLRVAQARQAQVDRKRLRALMFLHRSDGDLAGAAAGDQHVERAGLAERREGGRRKLVTQILIDRHRRDLSGDVHPARVGVLLVLLAHAL